MAEGCAACEAGIDAVIQKALSDIERVGVHIIGVWGDEDSHPFTYSVGRAKIGQPDVLMVAIHPMTAGHIINDVHKQGLELSPGDVLEDLLTDGYNLKVREVSPEDLENCTLTERLDAEAGRQTRVVQLLWPDTKNRFPGDPEYDPSMPHQHVSKEPPATIH